MIPVQNNRANTTAQFIPDETWTPHQAKMRFLQIGVGICALTTCAAKLGSSSNAYLIPASFTAICLGALLIESQAIDYDNPYHLMQEQRNAPHQSIPYLFHRHGSNLFKYQILSPEAFTNAFRDYLNSLSFKEILAISKQALELIPTPSPFKIPSPVEWKYKFVCETCNLSCEQIAELYCAEDLRKFNIITSEQFDLLQDVQKSKTQYSKSISILKESYESTIKLARNELSAAIEKIINRAQRVIVDRTRIEPLFQDRLVANVPENQHRRNESNSDQDLFYKRLEASIEIKKMKEADFEKFAQFLEGRGNNLSEWDAHYLLEGAAKDLQDAANIGMSVKQVEKAYQERLRNNVDSENHVQPESPGAAKKFVETIVCNLSISPELTESDYSTAMLVAREYVARVKKAKQKYESEVRSFEKSHVESLSNINKKYSSSLGYYRSVSPI